MKTIISRDFYNLFKKYSFWVLLALFAFTIYFLYLSYLNDFISIQSTIKEKNIHRGVTDIALIPYIKTATSIGLFIVIICFSRLFYYEQFSDFSLLFRSMNYSAATIITAKIIFIICVILLITTLTFLPIWVSSIFFHYDTFRLIILFIGCFFVYFCLALTSFFFSQIFSHTAICAALSILTVSIVEIMARIITEPIWLSHIIKQLSLITHFSQITIGSLSSADFIFFISYMMMMIIFIQRNIYNSYLQNV